MCGQCTKEGEQYLYATFIKPKARVKKGSRKEKTSQNTESYECLPTSSSTKQTLFETPPSKAEELATVFDCKYTHNISAYFTDEEDSADHTPSPQPIYTHHIFVLIIPNYFTGNDFFQREVEEALRSNVSLRSASKYFVLRLFPAASDDSLDWRHILRFLFHTAYSHALLSPQPSLHLTATEVEDVLRYSDQKIHLIVGAEEVELTALQQTITAILANIVHISFLPRSS